LNGTRAALERWAAGERHGPWAIPEGAEDPAVHDRLLALLSEA
jgi:hypothetical protein